MTDEAASATPEQKPTKGFGIGCCAGGFFGFLVLGLVTALALFSIIDGGCNFH